MEKQLQKEVVTASIKAMQTSSRLMDLRIEPSAREITLSLFVFVLTTLQLAQAGGLQPFDPNHPTLQRVSHYYDAQAPQKQARQSRNILQDSKTSLLTIQS